MKLVKNVKDSLAALRWGCRALLVLPRLVYLILTDKVFDEVKADYTLSVPRDRDETRRVA